MWHVNEQFIFQDCQNISKIDTALGIQCVCSYFHLWATIKSLLYFVPQRQNSPLSKQINPEDLNFGRVAIDTMFHFNERNLLLIAKVVDSILLSFNQWNNILHQCVKFPFPYGFFCQVTLHRNTWFQSHFSQSCEKECQNFPLTTHTISHGF